MVDFGKMGKVTFTFRCNTPRQVYLAGDFNNWDGAATPMHQDRDGVWHVTLKLAPGRHEFRYREDGGAWHTDYAACGVIRNTMGAFNSIVEVTSPIRLQALSDSYAFSGGSRQQ
jgi:1,4-alpha-glucan branching enzyme